MKNGDCLTSRSIRRRSAIPAGTHSRVTFFKESDLNGERHAIESGSIQTSAIILVAESGYALASVFMESIYSFLFDSPEFQKKSNEAFTELVRKVSTPFPAERKIAEISLPGFEIAIVG